MPADFSGIIEKLKRADENILNLQSEVARFFQECKYPVIPKLNDENILEALSYHRTLPIPLRFSVLAGEIIHHLRSCLDHIVWELSDETYRTSPNFRYIEFPILEVRPAPKDKFTRYERKIKGVRNADALKLIAELQPYHRINPIIDPLLVIHNMNIADKHRELVIISTTGLIEGLNHRLAREFMRHISGAATTPLTPELKREFDQHGKITPQVSFRDFGGGVIHPIVPRLTQLTSHVRSIIAQFDHLH
jgi:hypothetical protein